MNKDTHLIWEASRTTTTYKLKSDEVDVDVPSANSDIKQLKDWLQEFLSQTSMKASQAERTERVTKQWLAVKELAKEKIRDELRPAKIGRQGVPRGTRMAKEVEELSQLIKRVDGYVKLGKVSVKQADLMDQAKAGLAESERIMAQAGLKKPYPEPRPRGVKITIHNPTYIKLNGEEFNTFHNDLANYIKDNKLKVVSLGEGGGLKSLNPLTKSNAAKNWLDISDKLLVERVSTDDISGWDPSASVTNPFKPSSVMHDEMRKKAKAFLPVSKNEHYISVYSPELFGEDPNAPKAGLTKNQVSDIIENIAGDSISMSPANQESLMRLLDKVAIIKMGMDRLGDHKLDRREKDLVGSYKIELVYADDDSDPPLNDLYDSTIPLEIKRFIDLWIVNINNKSTFKEGEKSETSSLTRSRSSSLIEKAKQENIEKYGALTCTKCGIQPAIDYYQKNQKVSPSLASKIIEGHHIHGVRETEQATTEDIEILCSNCHIYETRISN